VTDDRALLIRLDHRLAVEPQRRSRKGGNMSSPTIDPGDVVTGITSSVTSGVGDNLTAIATVGGAIVAVGVVWRLAKRMVRG
jgi:hypothetical protein